MSLNCIVLLIPPTACSALVLISNFQPPPAPPSPSLSPTLPLRFPPLISQGKFPLVSTTSDIPDGNSPPSPAGSYQHHHNEPPRPAAIMYTVPQRRLPKAAATSADVATSSGVMYPSMNLRWMPGATWYISTFVLCGW